MITSIFRTSRANNRILPVLGLVFCACFCGNVSAEEKASNMDNPFGVLEFLHWDFQWANYKYADSLDLEKAVKLMKEAGVGWLRLDFLWQDIEPEEGKFEFAKYDRIVDLVYKNGINILGIFNYNTPWGSGGGKWNSPPRENKLFVKYALEVIRRYKDKIKYWEVWNEPDSAVYWSTQDGLKSYCVLLKDVYIAAKKEDPKCKILNGGLADGVSSVNQLYDNGAKDYFDVMNVHIFYNPLHTNAILGVDNFVNLIHKVMSRNNDAGKKIWVTEIGCPGVGEGIKTDNWWLGENPDENRQAEWLKDVYNKLLKDKRVEKIFWAFFRDCDRHWCNGIDHFGLIRWDLSKKPSFEAYKQCVREYNKQ